MRIQDERAAHFRPIWYRKRPPKDAGRCGRCFFRRVLRVWMRIHASSCEFMRVHFFDTKSPYKFVTGGERAKLRVHLSSSRSDAHPHDLVPSTTQGETAGWPLHRQI